MGWTGPPAPLVAPPAGPGGRRTGAVWEDYIWTSMVYTMIMYGLYIDKVWPDNSE